MKSYIFYLTVIFAVIVGFFYYLRELNVDNLKNRYLKSSTKRLLASQSMYNKLSKMFYNNKNESLAKDLDRYVREYNPKKRDKIREKILKKYFREYVNLSLLGLNQFQIFDNKGLCILRFRYPKIYGDNLYRSRDSIKRAINTQLFLKGFEIGKLVDGLRYIYPLFYDGKFVGGYEWSWSHTSLIDELVKIYDGWYIIVLDKEALVREMDISLVEKNYKPLKGYPDLVYQKYNDRVYSPELKEILKELFLSSNLYHKIKKKRNFVEFFPFKSEDFIISFEPIKDINNRAIGYFISVNKSEKLKEIDRIFWMEILFSLAIIALIYLFLDKSHRDKLFMRTLIDSQKDLVILTSGEEIADANRRFLEFFEVPDVKTFRKKYSCICNQFIELNDGREPKKLNIEENNWISRLLSKRDSDKRIAMFDKSRGEERIFIVSISRFRNSSLFVIVFSDITEIEQEKHFFKTESMIDHLTRAYNKRTFEMHLINRISEVKHYNRENIALIMFDIDHFKQINDQFGHSTGDKVLIEISTLVKKSLKGDNNLYRWGGEEFAILLENVVYIQAINFAERLREITSSHQFPVNRVVTCSFGVTMIRVDDTKESLIERVDANLYRAKSKGRNRVEKDIG